MIPVFLANGFEEIEALAVVDILRRAELDVTTVGIGGCWTAKQLELDKVLGKNNEVFWHWLPEHVEKYGSQNAVRDKAAAAEVYICSANAMTVGGEMVNIDGTGNRLASLAYGHKHQYLVVGMNKVCEDLEKAIWRVRNVAAVENTLDVRPHYCAKAHGTRLTRCVNLTAGKVVGAKSL